MFGDIDAAIDYYHQSLSRKPDDPFASEMLNRALNDALQGKLFLDEPSSFAKGGKDLTMDLLSTTTNNISNMHQSMTTDDGLSLSVESGDVDMSVTS